MKENISKFQESNKQEVTISEIHSEYVQDALGIGTSCPRLSWQVETNRQGWSQAGYEIKCFDKDGNIQSRTGRTESDESHLVPWPFTPLGSRERVSLQIRAWGQDGQASKWSKPYTIEAGLIHVEDWSAQFITPGWIEDISQAQPAPFIRREFEVCAPVKMARLYITALGVYEVLINGNVVGDHVMSPGWTSYHHRLRYQTYDVTGLINKGWNALGAILGDGWFRGRLGFNGGRRNIYGNQLALLGQLEITYLDGRTERIVTDENWLSDIGPILSSDIYDGETYDARLEQPGWAKPGFLDDDWKPVCRIERDLTTLESPLGPPVRRIEAISPRCILTSPSGRTILDFGQNLVGWVRIKVQGPAGQTIAIRHAEVIENGELCTRPLRIAKATDRYTLKGGSVETWEPRFTFHGFRYVDIENWPGKLTLNDIQAVVCHTDMKRTGWFETSDALINRFHENVVWSMRGNFLDIPTDCPQRDERMGWTGDIQIFSPAASFLYDINGFLASWLRDLAAEQNDAGGIVRSVVPTVMDEPPIGVAAWGDAAVIIPWVLYQHYGDRTLLQNQYNSMRTWVDWVSSQAGESHLWDHGIQYGDWLDPTAPFDRPEETQTDRYLIATAYFAHSADLASRAADVLGYLEDKDRFHSLAGEIRQAFLRKYLASSGRLTCETQTAYCLALEFGLLVDPEIRRIAEDRLVYLVKKNGYQVGSGFVGSAIVCNALTKAGRSADAYRLFQQQECPSWLFPVLMGATTIWERWDSMLPDGSVNLGEMTSFNHYVLGAVADWLHRSVGGISPAEPGYKNIEIRPHPRGQLKQVSAQHITPYGPAECKWIIQSNDLHLSVVIPPNTSAVVHLPGRGEPIHVGSGTYIWQIPFSEPDEYDQMERNG